MAKNWNELFGLQFLIKSTQEDKAEQKWKRSKTNQKNPWRIVYLRQSFLNVVIRRVFVGETLWIKTVFLSVLKWKIHSLIVWYIVTPTGRFSSWKSCDGRRVFSRTDTPLLWTSSPEGGYHSSAVCFYFKILCCPVQARYYWVLFILQYPDTY